MDRDGVDERTAALQPAIEMRASGRARAADPAHQLPLRHARADVGAPLGGFGFFVPRSEKRTLLACSYVSEKYRDRVPPDEVLLRAFVGGARDPGTLGLDDEDMAARIHAEVAPLLCLRGAPRLVHVHRHPAAMPQYRVGDATLLERIREGAAKRGLFLAGSLVQAFTREGYDLGRHPISLLSLGDLGWLQVTNFVVTGALYVACAVGLRRALRPGSGGTWGPRLVGALGVGLAVMADGETEFQIPVLVAMPTIGAIVGFNLTRRYKPGHVSPVVTTGGDRTVVGLSGSF